MSWSTCVPTAVFSLWGVLPSRSYHVNTDPDSKEQLQCTAYCINMGTMEIHPSTEGVDVMISNISVPLQTSWCEHWGLSGARETTFTLMRCASITTSCGRTSSPQSIPRESSPSCAGSMRLTPMSRVPYWYTAGMETVWTVFYWDTVEKTLTWYKKCLEKRKTDELLLNEEKC